MRVLFDQGTPAPLRNSLAPHDVATAHELGWSTFKNGELLEAAERAGFAVFVTTDQQLKYQQNLQGRRIVTVVLGTTDWQRIRSATQSVFAAIESASPGSYQEIAFP